MKLPPVLLKLPALALLGALFASDQTAATQEPPRPADVPAVGNEDYEIQARGPVHEAFAQPGTQKPAPAPIVAKQPPPAIEEVPPDQKPEGNNIQWITGYWAWDDDANNFMWVSGFWRDIPPGRQWVPGYWARLADGFQYVSGYWGVIGQQDNQYLPEPPETIDNGPSIAAPGDDYSYVPGLWVYRETRYLWRPGYWLRCYPNYCWTPASYCWTPSGYLYCPGFWDYPLLNRGLLFAPVCFNQPFWNNPGWFWRPNYCVQPGVFFGGLFARSNFNRYYFGDFYGAGYARRGFTPWANNRIGGAGDANFNFYRWQNRNNPRWEQNVNDTFARRGRGEDLPGRTLAQQDRQGRDRGDRPGGADRDPFRPDNPNVLAPLARLDPNVAKLERVSENRLKEERQSNQELRGLSRQRENVETKLAEKGPPTKNDAPRAAKLDLPKTTVRDSAYPPNNVLKGENKVGPGADNKGPGKDDNPRFGGGVPKAPERLPSENKGGNPPITKQPDFIKGQDNRPGEGKLPNVADKKGPPDVKSPQPSVNPKMPDLKAPTPPPAATKGGLDIRPLPELKGATPMPGKGDNNPAPVIRNPQTNPTLPNRGDNNPAPLVPPPVIRNSQPNPTPMVPNRGEINPAPVIRNPQPQANPTLPPSPAPVIRNPTPSPAPAIRNPSPPPAPPPAPRPAPAPVIRNPSPPPAPPRATPAPRVTPKAAPPAPRPAPAPKSPAPRAAAPAPRAPAQARPAARPAPSRPPASAPAKGKR